MRLEFRINNVLLQTLKKRLIFFAGLRGWKKWSRRKKVSLRIRKIKDSEIKLERYRLLFKVEHSVNVPSLAGNSQGVPEGEGESDTAIC
jgi:hypothetical protein